MTISALLEVRSLVKRFDAVEVLRGVDFSVKHGEFVCLLGPSGCGKSTLLRLIAGLEQPSGGDILIGGKSMEGIPPAERNLAMVFQSYALYPHLNVRSNMAFGLKLQGMPRAEINRRVADAARMLGIDQLLDRKPRQLSGGQRQRVAIGRAIVRDPQIFLFDEPLSNLDAALRTQTRYELARLHRELGRTMLFVTHDQVEAMTLSSLVVVLNEGRVAQIGKPLDLYHKPANRFVASFIGSPQMNFLPLKDFGGRRMGTAAPAGTTEIGIRPEHVLAHTNKKGAHAFPATIRMVEQLGVETIAFAALESGHAIVARLPGNFVATPGTNVHLEFDPAQLHFFDHSGHRVEEMADGRENRSAALG